MTYERISRQSKCCLFLLSEYHKIFMRMSPYLPHSMYLNQQNRRCLFDGTTFISELRSLTSTLTHNLSNFSSKKRNEEQIPRACSEFLWSFTMRLHSVKMQSQNCHKKGGLSSFTNLKADLITALDSAGTGCEQHRISDTYQSVFEIR